MVTPEASFIIKVNDKKAASITCRPDRPEEPAIGLLHSYGIFKSLDDIKTIQVHPNQKTISIQAQVKQEALNNLIIANTTDADFSEALKRGDYEMPSWSPQVRAKQIPLLATMLTGFHDALEVKGIFGAFKVAAISDRNGRIICDAGDVDTLVTIYRIFGKAFLQNIKLEKSTLLVSGRLRRDTILKAARFGVPLIIAFSVITSLAFETALKLGMEIIGVNEENNLIVYSTFSEQYDSKRTVKEQKSACSKGAF